MQDMSKAAYFSAKGGATLPVTKIAYRPAGKPTKLMSIEPDSLPVGVALSVAALILSKQKWLAPGTAQLRLAGLPEPFCDACAMVEKLLNVAT